MEQRERGPMLMRIAELKKYGPLLRYLAGKAVLLFVTHLIALHIVFVVPRLIPEIL